MGSFSKEIQIDSTLLTITYIESFQMFLFSIFNTVDVYKRQIWRPHTRSLRDPGLGPGSWLGPKWS